MLKISTQVLHSIENDDQARCRTQQTFPPGPNRGWGGLTS